MTKECEKCNKLQHRSEDEKSNYVRRLNRIEGQVKGIKNMVNENRHCDDILIQISAVNSAIKSLGQEILLNHMKTCMVEDIEKGNYQTIDEIMDIARKLM